MSAKSGARAPKIHMTTLGCSKNVYDSEILMGQMRAGRATFVDVPEEADALVINTCGFIELAKKESVDAILAAEEIKKAHPDKKVLVCGCLSQRYAKELQKEMPLIDAFFGAEDFDNILNYLELDRSLSPEFLYEKRHLTTPNHYAYLKISEGCNHTCAFCAIPLMRGRHRSRPLEQVVREAEILAAQGVKELIVISQDTTFYGLDSTGKQEIVPLLRALEAVKGIEWIRLHYLYPTTVQDALIDYMGESTRVVPYLDMPVQHITDHMLKQMKRGGKERRIREIFDRARSRIQDVTLRTTFIVGHPGETPADFEALKEFVRTYQFDRVGVFTYSHEENTTAFGMPDLDAQLKAERYAELMEIQQEISLAKNLAKIGTTRRVLIDEVDWANLTAVGRTAGDSPEIDNEVILEDLGSALSPGHFLTAEIIDATEYELYAKPENTV